MTRLFCITGAEIDITGGSHRALVFGEIIFGMKVAG